MLTSSVKCCCLYQIISKTFCVFIDNFGCQLKPNWEPVLGNYTGMDWTLCNQMCTTQGEVVFRVGKDACYCGGTLSFESLNSSVCDEPCSNHPDQICGDGSVVWVSLSGIKTFRLLYFLLYRNCVNN